MLYKNVVKPLLDIIFALSILLITSPILFSVALALYLFNKKNVLFFQLRPGKHGKLFTIIKFKTMTDDRDANGKLLPDHLRLTKLGRFIRSTSLDELPQLFNVLKGEMSFIGPRPLLPEYLKLYTEEQNKRHLVKPGITGWAQINGRNTISWTKKIELDIWYVNHISYKTDIIILLKTIKKVLMKDGISQEGQATTEAFNGTN